MTARVRSQTTGSGDHHCISRSAWSWLARALAWPSGAVRSWLSVGLHDALLELHSAAWTSPGGLPLNDAQGGSQDEDNVGHRVGDHRCLQAAAPVEPAKRHASQRIDNYDLHNQGR